MPDIISRDKAADEHKGALSLRYEGRERGIEKEGLAEGRWWREKDREKRLRESRTEGKNLGGKNKGGDRRWGKREQWRVR